MQRAIRTEDSDAVEQLTRRIEEAQKLQELMKDVNEAMRRTKKQGEAAQVLAMAEVLTLKLGYDADRARARAMELLKPDFCGRQGFASYELTNNNANIRRMQQRIETIQQVQATPETTLEGKHARYEDCPGENRVKLFFPGKPSVDVRTKLKGCGFRWAPSVGAWQAYRNYRSLSIAREVAGLVDVSEPVTTTGTEPEPDAFAQTCPEFQAEIRRLAEQCGRPVSSVFALWSQYSEQCRTSDQSALLSEFKDWYKVDLQPIDRPECPPVVQPGAFTSQNVDKVLESMTEELCYEAGVSKEEAGIS